MTEIPTSPAGAAIEPDAGLARIRDQVAAAIAARRPLQLLGAGTKRFLQAGPVADGEADAAVHRTDLARRLEPLQVTAHRHV